MSSREVQVTYTLYPTGNGDLRTALSGIRGQSPLRNLHWKPTSRTSLRTIQEVEIKLLELSEQPPPSDKASGSVLEQPLVNLCLVACDDSDLYKNSTRTFIKDWLSLVASRGGSHLPLIVLVNPPTASGTAHSSKNVFGRDRGIIAKLKADFNSPKRDMCVQVNLPSAGIVDPAVWLEVTSKLKESIVQALDGAIMEREDEVKRGEAQRTIPGWNFGTWFLMKESLAHSFEGVGLYEDALLIYEELEASFFQCVKERNINWYGRVGGTGTQDDSFHILDPKAKRYSELLVGDLITVFDFRIYVFARQCLLLGKLGRITEIAKRGQWFVASLAGRLRMNRADLAEYFVESWTYSACVDLVERCDEWSRIDRPNNDYSGLIAYESARSELLDIARVQVERLGVAVGHLPDRYPFSRSKDLTPESLQSEEGANDETSSNSRASLSNKTITAAIESKEKFLELYKKLTNEALDAYQACGKGNSAVRLKADLAALAMYLEDWPTAYELCRSLYRDCDDLHVWNRVMSFALEGALTAHSELQLPRDDDWMHLSLAYLRAYAAGDSSVNQEQLETIVTGLGQLAEPREEPKNMVFKIRLLSNTAALSDDASITELTLSIDNVLPVAVPVEEVRIELRSDTFGTISYSAGAMTLQPGEQTLTVSCSTSITGLAALHEASVQLGQIRFMSRYPGDHVIVPIHRNLQGLRTVLRMPDTISLDEEPRVVLDVHIGTQPLSDVQVVLSSLQNEVTYDLERATAEGHPIQPSREAINLGSLQQETVISMVIPYKGIPRNELATADIIVQYTSASGKSSTYKDEQTVYMGLAITVNVQDFFRPNALVSSFVIASEGYEYVRIKSVDLKSPTGGCTVEPCRGQWEKSLLIPPSQPMSCLFRVRPLAKPSGELLRLSIQYRTIGDEIETAAQTALNALVTPSATLVRLVRERIADRASWLQKYMLSEDIRTVFDDAWLNGVPSSTSELAKKFMADMDPQAVRWRTLRIPVEIPLRRHLTTVRLTPAAQGTLYEGRALPFDIELTTSLAWLGDQSPDNIRVTYDVQASVDDWVVIGKKRGIYTASPDKSEMQRIVLVPVRHGVLTLPPVSVQLVDQGQSDPSLASKRVICETYIANAAEGVRVLPAKTGMTALVPIAPDWED